MSSSSSTETATLRVEPGAEVAGFRLERELGRGTQGVVYEATQVNLDRRVALKLLPAGDGPAGLARSLEWPEHPRVVSMYAAGPWEHGQFVAMQLVRGSSLARLGEAGELDAARSLELLADVASALDAAHRAGIVHGGITARNVLVDGDGRALLSDFGLMAAKGSVATDRADFAALLRDCLGDRLPRLPEPRSTSAGELVRLAREALPALPRADGGAGVRRRRRQVVAGAGICSLAAAAAAVVVLLDGSAEEPDRVPQVQRGAQAYGSELSPRGISSVDCSGQPPSGESQACTLVQTRLPGRPLVPPEPGAIRNWVVRGARGELALQVIHRRGDRYVSVTRSRYQLVPDEGVHVLPANLGVRAGDRIGVQIAPGAAIGVRRGVPGASTARWVGQLGLTARPIELGAGTGFDHELLLRVEYAPGLKPRLTGQLSGRSARHAPAGRELRSVSVDVRGGVRRVTVLKLEDGIAVDLFAGDRRLARLPAPDADPAGRLLYFAAASGPYPLLRWRNPDGRTVSYEYTVNARTLTARS